MSGARLFVRAGGCCMAGKALVWALAAGVLLGLPAPGLAASADSTERERIAAERRAAESRFVGAQADCQTRFMMTECLDTARAERRQALDGLQRRQLVLDDARRRERAAERLTLQRTRAAEQAEAASASASASALLQQQARRPAASASRPAPVAARTDTSAEVAAAASAARQAEAAAAPRRRAAYDQRQQAARDHQQALAARNARQDAIKPPAAGLPVPGASSAGR